MTRAPGDIIIYGAGGLGREILQIVRLSLCADGAQVLGYVDDGVEPGTARSGAQILGGREYLDSMDKPYSLVFGMADPSVKRKLYGELSLNPLISFPNVIHPGASISEYASLGEGIVVTASCLVSVDVTIGNCVFLNYGTMIGHDAVIGDFSSIMPMAAISGNVTIGECCLIGVHCAIIQGIAIGLECTVGMGSIVIRDIPDGATVLGNPAIRIS